MDIAANPESLHRNAYVQAFHVASNSLA